MSLAFLASLLATCKSEALMPETMAEILARRKRVEASAMSLAICAVLNFHSAHTTEWAESISGNGVCMYVLQRLLITLLRGVTDRYNHTYYESS